MRIIRFLGGNLEQNELNSQSPAVRIPLKFPIEYKKNYARQATEGTLKNISLSGAYLETLPEGLGIKEKITLYFNIEGRRRKINALIIWKNNAGAGISFQHFNNRDLQMIDDLMYFVEAKRNTTRSLFDDIVKKIA